MRTPVARIAEAYPHLPIQVGGGIRSEETVEAYLAAGVRWCIIGTKAVREPHFVAEICLEFPGHVMVGLDARDGRWRWRLVQALAPRRDRHGAALRARRRRGIVYTDISRDGMLTGVNVEATRRLAAAINIPVIASGGITNLDDIRALCAAGEPNIVGAITGRAIYEGTLDFAAGQRLLDDLCGD